MWTKKFINSVFSNGNENRVYSNIILNNPDLLAIKEQYMPSSLFKYYRPTFENVFDIMNGRLWVANPKSFNDPFDCVVGYDKEYFERRKFLEIISKYGCEDRSQCKDGFTNDDKNRIYQSHPDDVKYPSRFCESFYEVRRMILDSKSDKFRDKIRKVISEEIEIADKKISSLRDVGIRISCFSQFDRYDEFNKQIVMWSHYADNHRGFCVEYDLSLITKYKSILDFSNRLATDNFEIIDEQNRTLIKAGLFPVHYCAGRVNVPYLKLNRYKLDSTGKSDIRSCEDLLYKSFLVKSANWSYEKEWRLILDENICSYYRNKIPFPYAKTIFLGCYADDELIDTMIEIGKKQGCDVVLLKMDGNKFLLQESSTRLYEFDKKIREIYSNYII